MNKVIKKINDAVVQMDRFPLWVMFPILLAAVMAPILFLGEGSVFDYHDQWDETMMNTVFSARHLGDGMRIWPEMMGGINATGLQPAAVLFVPLYRLLPTFWAFVVQYVIAFTAGFFGMYLCVKELTESRRPDVSACCRTIPFTDCQRLEFRWRFLRFCGFGRGKIFCPLMLFWSYMA